MFGIQATKIRRVVIRHYSISSSFARFGALHQHHLHAPENAEADNQA